MPPKFNKPAQKAVKRRADNKPLRNNSLPAGGKLVTPPRQSKSVNPARDTIEASRRRTWYTLCAELGIDEQSQRVIVARFLPQDASLVPTQNGEVSRNSIFRSDAGFRQAMRYLENLKNSRIRKHQARDGNPAEFRISERQLNYMLDLGKVLRWDENGEEDLRFRLQKFCAKMCSQAEGIRLFDSLTRKDVRVVIEALKSMAKRMEKPTNA